MLAFLVEKADRPTAAGVLGRRTELVRFEPMLEIDGDARVQRAVAATQDIDEPGSHRPRIHRGAGLVQGDSAGGPCSIASVAGIAGVLVQPVAMYVMFQREEPTFFSIEACASASESAVQHEGRSRMVFPSRCFTSM